MIESLVPPCSHPVVIVSMITLVGPGEGDLRRDPRALGPPYARHAAALMLLLRGRAFILSAALEGAAFMASGRMSSPTVGDDI